MCCWNVYCLSGCLLKHVLCFFFFFSFQCDCSCNSIRLASPVAPKGSQAMSNFKGHLGQDVEKQGIKLPKKWTDHKDKVMPFRIGKKAPCLGQALCALSLLLCLMEVMHSYLSAQSDDDLSVMSCHASALSRFLLCIYFTMTKDIHALCWKTKSKLYRFCIIYYCLIWK